MASIDRLRRGPLLGHQRETRMARMMVDRLAIKTPSIDTPARRLSGGNQQKIVLAKWLGTGAKILIVDEPTRGVDIGAKQIIHQILHQLAMDGIAILMISSELPELLASADRILVMRDGRLVDEVPHTQATEQRLLRPMAGLSE